MTPSATGGQRHRWDAIVVGGGHNGLTAGAYLARAGLATLVVEAREMLGGCCVTEEIAPGVRASTTSYIASMLRPRVIRDLRLAEHGLRMVACTPGLQIALAGGRVVADWNDTARTAAELSRYSARDAVAFVQMDTELRGLARRLQPLFLELPPDLRAGGVRRLAELARVGRHLRGIRGPESELLTRLVTGTLGEYLDSRFQSMEARCLVLANTVYGKHGGPYEPGTLFSLVFHLLSGGEQEVQGFFGHALGGMGAITQAIAAAGRSHGMQALTGTPVAQIAVRDGAASGVVLTDGTELKADVVVSAVDPKRTFLRLVDEHVLPIEFVEAVRGIKMDGPCAKVNLVLDAEPQVAGMPVDADPLRRALFTVVPEPRVADDCYDIAKRGELPPAEQLWVDCVVGSNVDDSLAPAGRHVLTCFVQYVPYRLAGGWDASRDELGERVLARVGGLAPNVPGAVLARQVLTPLDLERTYGLTEGNIFHGDLRPDQLFHMRPVPGWARYRSPVTGLYMGSAGTHPGGGVTGAPGYNVAHRVLGDLRRRRFGLGR